LDESAEQDEVLAAEGQGQYMGRVDGGKESVLTRGGLPWTE